MRKNKTRKMERFSRVWTPIMAACINCGRMAVSQLTPVSYCFWRKSRWDGPTYICWAVMHKLKSKYSRPFPEECKWKHKFVFMYYLELKKKTYVLSFLTKKTPTLCHANCESTDRLDFIWLKICEREKNLKFHPLSTESNLHLSAIL